MPPIGFTRRKRVAPRLRLRSTLASLEVLRVGALDLGAALVAVGGGVELHPRYLLARRLRAGEPEHARLAGAARAAVLLAAAVVGDDDLLRLRATDAGDLDRGDVGRAEVLLLAVDVAAAQRRGARAPRGFIPAATT